MARRPVDRLAAARWPQGRQVIWTAIRHRARANWTGGTVSRPEIARDCGLEIPKDTIRTYMRALEAAGIIGLVDRPAPGKGACRYRLLRDPGAEAPRVTRAGKPVTQGLATENIWRTLKRAGAVTAAELALLASTDEIPVSPVAVADYVKYLKRAGYVRVAKPADRRGGKEVVIFLAARDPGPLPPRIQRVKRVWDPNSERVVWPVESVPSGTVPARTPARSGDSMPSGATPAHAPARLPTGSSSSGGRAGERAGPAARHKRLDTDHG